MDRIEERLKLLCMEQDKLTYAEHRIHLWHSESHRLRVNYLRNGIAADWRAMVEALEGGLDLLYGLTQWIPNDEQEILERMHTTLARVKGE